MTRWRCHNFYEILSLHQLGGKLDLEDHQTQRHSRMHMSDRSTRLMAARPTAARCPRLTIARSAHETHRVYKTHSVLRHLQSDKAKSLTGTTRPPASYKTYRRATRITEDVRAPRVSYKGHGQGTSPMDHLRGSRARYELHK